MTVTQDNKGKKALIAMSGGVDSSVAAYLAKKQGYDCIGCAMKLYDNPDIGIPRSHTCCTLEDTEDARSVARSLGMPYYVFNFSMDFKKRSLKNLYTAMNREKRPTHVLTATVI